MTTHQNKQLSCFSSEQFDIVNEERCDKSPKTAYKIYIDGASRNNPGLSGAGFSLSRDGKALCEQGFFVGIKTNNQAEYYALLLGLFFTKEYAQKGDTILIYSDSQLLVRQMTGIYRVKDETLKKMQSLAQLFMKDYSISFCHVLREYNVKADLLANRGIDKSVPLPKKFLDMLQHYNIV